jgi:hypothetical protein
LTLETSGTLQNSQCSINLASSFSATSGNTLALNLAITFPGGFAGAKHAYAYVQDAGGLNSGWQPLGTWTVPANSSGPPVAASVIPSSGTGASQTFSATFSDPGGYASISTAQVDFASSLTGSGACWVYFAGGSNLIYLSNDAGSGWLGPLTLETSGTLQNSQCSINLASSFSATSGNTLALNLAITFSVGFAGPKHTYGYVQDAGGLNSGWQPLGVWTVN